MQILFKAFGSFKDDSTDFIDLLWIKNNNINKIIVRVPKKIKR